MITKMPKSKKQNKKTEKVEVAAVPIKKKAGKKSAVKMDAENAECDGGPAQTVLIGNLSADTSRAQLAKLFTPYGKIMLILICGPIEDKLQAYVVFDSVKAANNALKVNGTVLNENKLIVQKPEDLFECSNPANSVMVKYEKSSVTEDDLKETFSGCGYIEYMHMYKSRKTLECVGLACLQFKSPDAVDSALEIECTADDEKPIRVEKFSAEKKGLQKAHSKKNLVVGDSEHTVFVTNLTKTVNSKKLKKVFSSCGEVEYAKILMTADKRSSKGKAFVCFKSPEAVSAALKLNDTTIDEQVIQVQKYSIKPKTNSSILKKKGPQQKKEQKKKTPKKNKKQQEKAKKSESDENNAKMSVETEEE